MKIGSKNRQIANSNFQNYGRQILSCHGNVNVGVHITATLKCRYLWEFSLNGFEVFQLFWWGGTQKPPLVWIGLKEHSKMSYLFKFEPMAPKQCGFISGEFYFKSAKFDTECRTNPFATQQFRSLEINGKAMTTYIHRFILKNNT